MKAAVATSSTPESIVSCQRVVPNKSKLVTTTLELAPPVLEKVIKLVPEAINPSASGTGKSFSIFFAATLFGAATAFGVNTGAVSSKDATAAAIIFLITAPILLLDALKQPLLAQQSHRDLLHQIQLSLQLLPLSDW